MNNAKETKKDLGAQTKGLLLVICSSFVYGITPIASKLGYAAGLNSYSLVFGRYLIGIVMYFFIIVFTKDTFRITLKQFFYITFVTVLGYTCILLQFVSYNYLSSGIASLTAMTYVVFAVLFEMIFRIAKGVWYKWVTLVLSFAGIVLIFLSPGEGGGISTIGLVIGLIGAVFGGMQIIVFGNKILKNLSIPTIFFYEMMLPILCTPIIAKIIGVQPFPSSAEQWMYSCIVSVLNLGIGLLCFYSAIRLIGGGNASLIGVSEPVFAFIAGSIVFKDPISLRMLIGGLTVLGSILFLTVCQNREAKKVASELEAGLEKFKEEASKEAEAIVNRNKNE